MMVSRQAAPIMAKKASSGMVLVLKKRIDKGKPENKKTQDYANRKA
jgi:hypothetical protein